MLLKLKLATFDFAWKKYSTKRLKEQIRSANFCAMGPGIFSLTNFFPKHLDRNLTNNVLIHRNDKDCIPLSRLRLEVPISSSKNVVAGAYRQGSFAHAIQKWALDFCFEWLLVIVCALLIIGWRSFPGSHTQQWSTAHKQLLATNIKGSFLNGTCKLSLNYEVTPHCDSFCVLLLMVGSFCLF